MGSLSLTCPMCCGETFNNSETLKYHLLSITDNLYCPGCSTRTYSMAALIQHLDSCGKKEEEQKSEEVTTDQTEYNDNREGSDILINDLHDHDDNTINESFLATVNEEGIMIVGEGRTIQVDENGDIQVLEKGNPIDNQNSNNNVDDGNEQDEHSNSKKNLERNDSVTSIPDTSELLNDDENEFMELVDDDVQLEDSTMLRVKKEDDQSNEKEQEDSESEVMYSCSTCSMSFASVLEHIKEYHDGQEVVLEMAEQQIDEIAASTQNLTESSADANTSTEDSEKPTSNPVKTNLTGGKQGQSMNTLKTEECIDSDGRLYTRKVVQIERFWDRTPVTLSSTKAPMIEKFFSNVEGVKVRDKSVTVAPTRMYRCNQCLEQFAKLSDFRIHVCLQGTNHCDQCEQAFATPKALQIHMKSHDSNDFPSQKLFLCTICGTEFLTHKSLRLHSRMHAPVRARHVDAPVGTGEETFDCNECGAKLSESYRAAHMALHAGDPITCHVCNRKFDSHQSLYMHAAVHSEIPMNSNNGVTTNSAAIALANEMIIATSEDPTDPIFISTGITPNADTQVDATASTTAAVTTTTTTTTALTDSAEMQNQKPYQCQHCGRRFTRPHEKVKHERIHTGEKPHSCEVCGKKFRVSYCLTLHMRTHTGVRPYECQHCGKRFKASSVYNHHLLTHGEERAYTCPYCPKTFKTRVQLAGHKNSHTKPFRCTECSRPFASLYAARAHIQTHKQDNNLKFSCNICGALYGRAFALKDHVKQHEKDNILVPPEATREEEVQQIENFLIPRVEEVVDDELIVPSPPASNDPMDVELVEEV